MKPEKKLSYGLIIEILIICSAFLKYLFSDGKLPASLLCLALLINVIGSRLEKLKIPFFVLSVLIISASAFTMESLTEKYIILSYISLLVVSFTGSRINKANNFDLTILSSLPFLCVAKVVFAFALNSEIDPNGEQKALILFVLFFVGISIKMIFNKSKKKSKRKYNGLFFALFAISSLADIIIILKTKNFNVFPVCCAAYYITAAVSNNIFKK